MKPFFAGKMLAERGPWEAKEQQSFILRKTQYVAFQVDLVLLITLSNINIFQCESGSALSGFFPLLLHHTLLVLSASSQCRS